jgi:hypothetical protein
MRALSSPSRSARAGARAACEEAVGLFLRGAGDPRAALDHALELDPDCVPALLLRVGIAVAAKDRAALPVIDAALARLARPAPRLDERERGHVDAAYAWRAGAPARAAALYADVARRWPHDLLALRLAQSCFFLLGDAQALHDVAAGAIRHWHAGLPGYDCALALHAFGLEEGGDPARAERVGRRALEIEPRNAVAVHAVAHALYGAGDARAGAHWMLRHRPIWANDAAMASHNGWHLALFRLAAGAPGDALALYDALVAPAVGASATDAADAAALLWRLELGGIDVGGRWSPVATAFALQALPSRWALVDVHAALAFAAAGRAREMDRLQGALARGGAVAREVALPLARAIAAHASGAYAESAALLAAHRRDARRLGGSPVQREIVDLTLATARSRAAGGAHGETRAA